MRQGLRLKKAAAVVPRFDNRVVNLAGKPGLQMHTVCPPQWTAAMQSFVRNPALETSLRGKRQAVPVDMLAVRTCT